MTAHLPSRLRQNQLLLLDRLHLALLSRQVLLTGQVAEHVVVLRQTLDRANIREPLLPQFRTISLDLLDAR